MQNLLKPIQKKSLKDECIARFEELILSGKLSIGEKLPPERELAMMLGVGRPVIHESLLDLEYKGLVTLIPRTGAVVNDYRTKGSVNLLTSLFRYQQGELTPRLLNDVTKLRWLIEVESTKLAALNRTEDHLAESSHLTATLEQPTGEPLLTIQF